MSIPDYYKVLGVFPTATQQEIRDAYKKAALKTHPDRVSATDPARTARTRKFQEVNDAYYTLSDPQRRRDYDEARRLSGASSSFFGDSSGSRTNGFPQHPSEDSQEEQFGNAFEEMLREEGVGADGTPGNGGGKLYGIVGGISGAALGFIVGSVPGMFAGAVAGNRLGAVRDAKGKSVYEVFQQLPQGDKAKILADLASKVLSHAASA
ncbi:DnaJ domain-containing protein [Terfezia claveryi]|nr:DnaJ domain-containing protein [Terfezia claveryi]